MYDVKLGNFVPEMLTAKTKFAINCCRGACPGLRLIFGDVGVGVMELGDGYDPVVNPHIWHHVQ